MTGGNYMRFRFHCCKSTFIGTELLLLSDTLSTAASNLQEPGQLQYMPYGLRCRSYLLSTLCRKRLLIWCEMGHPLTSLLHLPRFTELVRELAQALGQPQGSIRYTVLQLLELIFLNTILTKGGESERKVIYLFILTGGWLLYNFVMVFAIHQPESATGIHVSPPSCTLVPPPYPPCPSRLLQSAGFGFPVSDIKLALLICFTYGKVYVSMLFPQITPPSPFPTISKSLFFMSVSPLPPCT